MRISNSIYYRIARTPDSRGFGIVREAEHYGNLNPKDRSAHPLKVDGFGQVYMYMKSLGGYVPAVLTGDRYTPQLETNLARTPASDELGVVRGAEDYANLKPGDKSRHPAKVDAYGQVYIYNKYLDGYVPATLQGDRYVPATDHSLARTPASDSLGVVRGAENYANLNLNDKSAHPLKVDAFGQVYMYIDNLGGYVPAVLDGDRYRPQSIYDV